MGNRKYHDEDWLRTQYVDNKRTTTDLAGECDVTPTTISDWLSRHDIPTRGQREAQQADGDYTNEDWLRKEYVDRGRSMKDIGEECGVTAATILKWLRRFDIDTRHYADHKRKQAIGLVYSGGELGDLPGPYVYAGSSVTRDGERVNDRVAIHQLLAIAEGADPHKVFSNGEYHCHHDNGIRWDNRPSNIEFLRGEDHMSQHSDERVRTPTGEWE